MHERWMNMTPEQREAFIQQRREGLDATAIAAGAGIVKNAMTVRQKRRKPSE
jgi:DNA-directed RNA polymerase specialized sigma24 family protein